MTIGAFAQAQWLEKYASMKGVTRVYMSETMLRMVTKDQMSQDNTSSKKKNTGAKIKGVMASKIKGLLVLTGESKVIGAAIRKDMQAISGNKTYKLLTQAQNNGDETAIYVVEKKRGKRIFFSEILMFHFNKGHEAGITQILGEFEQTDIASIAS